MKDHSARDKAMDKLVATQLRARLKPGSESCPNAEILAAYVERTLAPREHASCETHLASCLGCQALVAELLRLSEDDGPAVIQTAAGSSALAATAPRFRWAWAGSALAAILVAGLWYTGEFRNVLQQTPEVPRQIRNNSAPLPAAHGAAPTEEKGSAPPASDQRDAQNNRAGEDKTPNDKVRTGAHAANITAPQAQNMVIGGPAAAPPAVTDRFSAARSGDIATPSERAKLAKVGPGEGGGVGSGVGAGVAGGSAGGVMSSTSSNSTPAEKSAEKSKDATSPVPPNTPAQLSRAARKAVNGSDDSLKPAHREAQAKDESASIASSGGTLRDKERAKQAAAASPTVSAATEEVEVQAEPATPQWRVGRRGLIQKSDSNGKWKKRKSGVKTDLKEIAFSSPDAGWAVGRAGTILQTTDGGATWTKLPSPTAEDLVHVTATSNQEASVVARGGQTFETTDGGKTWSARR